VNIRSEVIPVSLPWIETSELTRFILDWELAKEQWQDELSDFSANIELQGLENICRNYVVG